MDTPNTPASDPALHVISPDGTLGTIDPQDQAKAINSGYKIATPQDIQEAALQKQYGEGLGNELKAGALGAARTLSFGGSDVALTQSGLASPEALHELKERNPMSSGLGEIAGIAAPALLTGGASLEAKGALAAAEAGTEAAAPTIAKTIGKTLGAPMDAISGVGHAAEKGVASLLPEVTQASPYVQKILSKLIPKAAGSAVEGAFFGAGNLVSEDALGEKDLNAENLISHIGLGAVLGGGLGTLIGMGGVAKDAISAGLASQGLKDAGSKAASLGDKVLSTVTGVGQEDIDRYRADPAAIKAQRPLEDIKGDVDAQIGTYQNNIDVAQEAATKAKADLRDHTIEMRQQADQAQNALDSSYQNQKQVLKERNNVTDMRFEVQDAIGELKQQVSDGSSAAYDVLGQQQGNVSMDGALRRVQKGIADLHIDGKAPASDSAIASMKNLERLQAQLKEIDNASPAAVKDILRQLDDDVVYGEGQLSKNPQADLVKKQVRHGLDQELKTRFPAYDAAMQPVQENSKLLAKLSTGYSNEGRIYSKLQNITSSRAQELEVPLLKELGDKTGRDFIRPIQDATQARQILESPKYMDALKSQLPEAQAVKDATTTLKALKGQMPAEEVEKALANNPIYQAHKQAEAALLATKEKYEPVVSRLSPYSTQSKLKSIMADRSIEARADLARLSDLSGHDFVKEIENLSTKEAFEKGMMNGSRNVNTYGVLGLAAHAPGLGVITGYVMDKFGPKVGQFLLDSYVKLKAPSIAALATIERTAQTVDSKIGQGVRDLFSTAPRAVVTLGADALMDHSVNKNKWDRKPGDAQEAYSKHLDDISAMATSPDHMLEKLNQATAALHQVAPGIAAQVSTTSVAAISFLNSKLPKKPDTGIFNQEWKPSTAELSKFARYMSVINRPLSVLEDLKTGSLTQEHMEALKTVYPKLYDQMSRTLMDKLTSYKGTLPYAKRLSIQMFLQQPLEPSTRSIPAMQQQFAPQQPPQSQPGSVRPSQKGLSNLKLSAATLTPFQRSSQR